MREIDFRQAGTALYREISYIKLGSLSGPVVGLCRAARLRASGDAGWPIQRVVFSLNYLLKRLSEYVGRLVSSRRRTLVTASVATRRRDFVVTG